MARESRDRAAVRPTHRLLLWSTDNDKERPTEVGAAWKLESGKGFSVVLKRGLAVSCPKGARLMLLEIDDKPDERNR